MPPTPSQVPSPESCHSFCPLSPFTKGGKIFKKLKNPPPETVQDKCGRNLPGQARCPQVQAPQAAQPQGEARRPSSQMVRPRAPSPMVLHTPEKRGLSPGLHPGFLAQSSRTMGSLVLAGLEGTGRGAGGRTDISAGFTLRGKLGLRAARRISRCVRAFRKALQGKQEKQKRCRKP